RLVIEPLFGLGVDRVRARADEREIAGEDHVYELRQLVETPFTQETTDARYPRIGLGHESRGRGVGRFEIHRAKFVDLDEIVVEPVAFLSEQSRAATVEL